MRREIFVSLVSPGNWSHSGESQRSDLLFLVEIAGC